MADAFMAGVEPGGLTNVQEIRILLCYMLRSVNAPVPRDALTDIITAGGMANYFDTEEAIEELLRLQHLVQSEDRLIATTVTGAQIGAFVSECAVMKLLAQMDFTRELMNVFRKLSPRLFASEEDREKLRQFMDKYKDSAQRHPQLYH